MTFLTICGFGVVFPEGVVFGQVGEEEAQRVLRDVVDRHHAVVPNDVGKRNGRELFFCVGLHRANLWLFYNKTNVQFSFYIFGQPMTRIE